MIRTIPLRAFLFMGAMCGAFALATLALTAGIVHAQAARTFVQEIPGTDVTVTMALEAEGPPSFPRAYCGTRIRRTWDSA